MSVMVDVFPNEPLRATKNTTYGGGVFKVGDVTVFLTRAEAAQWAQVLQEFSVSLAVKS